MNYKINVQAIYELNGQEYSKVKTYTYGHYDPVLNPNGLYSAKDFKYLQEKSQIDLTDTLIKQGAQKIRCTVASAIEN